MTNMSYCRFRNTASDLSECADAIDDMICGEAPPLSKDERDAFVRLLQTMSTLLEAVCSSAGIEEDEVLDFLAENHGVSLEAAVDHIQACAEAGQGDKQ